MKFFFRLFLPLWGLAIVANCQSQPSAIIIKIDKAQLGQQLKDNPLQLIDVRTAGEYAAGHIEGAVNIDVLQEDAFLRQLRTLNTDKPVYLYCKMGGRSNRAAQLLKKEGFSKIYDYSGGWSDWSSDGN